MLLPLTGLLAGLTWVLLISSFLVIAFGTSIITTGLADRMEIIKENRVQAQASKMHNFIIVCGFGMMGQYFCEELKKVGKKFIRDFNKEVYKYASIIALIAGLIYFFGFGSGKKGADAHKRR